MKRRGLTNAQRLNLTDKDVDDIRLYFKSLPELAHANVKFIEPNDATIAYRDNPTIEN
jgi:hypothetical protein